MTSIDYVALDQIRIDGGTQARAGLHEATVEEYAATWQELSYQQNGLSRMPPLIVYHDGESYWLSDGFHRLEAYKRFLVGGSASASPRVLRCEVRQGTRRDAVLCACGANSAHGLRRTNADKRRAVETLLRDEEWSQWSDRRIADACAVHHELVGRVREEVGLTGGFRQSADGRTMNVRGIREANAARAAVTGGDDLLAMRKRFLALGYEQFYTSDRGYTSYHPQRGVEHYAAWSVVEAAIVRKENVAADLRTVPVDSPLVVGQRADPHQPDPPDPPPAPESCFLNEVLAARLRRLGGRYVGSDRKATGVVIHAIDWPDEGGELLRMHRDNESVAALIAKRERDPLLAAHAFLLVQQAKLRTYSEHALISQDDHRGALSHLAAVLDWHSAPAAPAAPAAPDGPLAMIESQAATIERLIAEKPDMPLALVRASITAVEKLRSDLEDHAGDSDVSDAAYDALSARIGDAQRALDERAEQGSVPTVAEVEAL